MKKNGNLDFDVYLEFKKNIEENKMLLDKDRLIVALSGGVDSVSLLCLLKKYIEENNLDIKIEACHINHQIRSDALNDENFCKKLCDSLSVKLHIWSFNAEEKSKKNGQSVEDASRTFRYETFSKNFKNYKIFIGHNKEDKCETLLLNLARGAGLDGLCSMNFISLNKYNSLLYRPLLSINKIYLYEYLKSINCSHKEDYTNADVNYTRNYVRINILPLFENVNQNYIDNIYKSSMLLKSDKDYFDEIVKEVYKKVYINKFSINLKVLYSYHISIQRKVIRYAIKLSFTLTDITLEHIDNILELGAKNGTKAISLPSNITATTYNYVLFLESNIKNTQNEAFSYNIIPEKLIYVKEINQYFFLTSNSDTEFLTDCLKNQSNFNFAVVKSFEIMYNYYYDILLRYRQNGDKIYIPSLRGTKQIKKYFIDEKIPIHFRDKTPLITKKDSNEVLCILDKKGICSTPTDTKDNKIYLYILEEI